MRVRGKVSWFGGAHDSMNTGTALGVSDRAPGVAVRPGGHYLSGRKTLGGYWRITIGGRTAVLRQTDIGPNQSTGRRIDVTAGALKKLGFNERNFPTDSIGKAVYLGKRRPKGNVVTEPAQRTALSPERAARRAALVKELERGAKAAAPRKSYSVNTKPAYRGFRRAA